MHRRDCIRLPAAALLATGLGSGLLRDAQAHTPYNQWRVYRRKHLLIGCHKVDMRTYVLAQRLVKILQVQLPAASAGIIK